MVVGAVLANQLGVELDVYLCRKMRSMESGHSLGSVSESGAMAIDRMANGIDAVTAESLVEERSRQMMQIACSRSMFRAIRAPALIAGRSVVVADDGLVTGSTMMAALDGIRRNTIRELVVAVPIASSQRLAAIRRRCDRTICIIERDGINDLKECYAEFPSVSEDEAVQLLKTSNF